MLRRCLFETPPILEGSLGYFGNSKSLILSRKVKLFLYSDPLRCLGDLALTIQCERDRALALINLAPSTSELSFPVLPRTKSRGILLPDT